MLSIPAAGKSPSCIHSLEKASLNGLPLHQSEHFLPRLLNTPLITPGWFRTVGRAPSQQDLKHIAWGVLKALAAMSNCGFIHGDVKFDNVLWRESNGVPEVHLIDYGNSFPLEAVRCYTDEYEVAPLGFRAPEVAKYGRP